MGVMHPCNYPGCMKKFDRKYNLKCHLRIHSNEKPYRCHHDNCSRSFRWKSSLNHHLMSLDHTPASARRARKARGTRRRQLSKSPTHAVVQRLHSETENPPQDIAMDIPSLSPVSSSRTFQKSPSRRALPPKPVDQMRLDQRVDMSDGSISSIPDAALNMGMGPDLQYLNKQQLYANQTRESLGAANREHIYNQSSLFHAQVEQLLPATSRTHAQAREVDSKPLTQWSHIQSSVGVEPRRCDNPHHLDMSASFKHETRVFVEESSRPRDAPAVDATIGQAVDDALSMSMVTPKKMEHHELSTVKASQALDMAALFGPASLPKELPTSKLGSQGTYKGQAPLVSIFEELSLVSPMAFPSSLDSLFPPTNVDANGMKSF